MNRCSTISTLPDQTDRSYTLRLYNNEERVDLPLYPAGTPRVLSEIVSSHKARVYFNRMYDGQLISSHTWDIRNMEVQINNYPVNMTFYPANGTIRFADNAYNKNIFFDSFGLCQIRLNFHCAQGWQTLESARFQVMVHPSEENASVDRMGRYVSSRNRILLFGTQSDYSSWIPPVNREIRSMEDKVRLLKKMTLVLESCWRWIRTNPRVDNSRSLSAAFSSGSSAIRYLMRNPEALHASSGLHGIQISGKAYLPVLPGRTSQVESTDVYENQAILAFLRAVYTDICSLRDQLMQAKQDLPTVCEERDGYITSTFFLFHASRLAMENLIEDLNVLASQYSSLYEAYRSAIPASEIVLSSMPVPTPAFRSLPAYRQIFEHMHAWYELSSVSAQDMRFMETFLQVTTLYEVFVLTRLLEYFLQEGFELLSARMHEYEFESEVLYENTSINNVFEFRREDLKVTLYYQPVIYDEKKQPEGLIDLYRNTSLSYPKGWGEPSRGKYYTPDYLIEIERDGTEGRRFILGDAKYTTIRNVKDYKIFPLVYKYLFSISCAKAEDRITGLYIFQGKSVDDKKEIVHSIYDLSSSPHTVFPQVEIISLNQSDAAHTHRQFLDLHALFEKQLDMPAPIRICPDEAESVQTEPVLPDVQEECADSAADGLTEVISECGNCQDADFEAEKDSAFLQQQEPVQASYGMPEDSQDSFPAEQSSDSEILLPDLQQTESAEASREAPLSLSLSWNLFDRS